MGTGVLLLLQPVSGRDSLLLARGWLRHTGSKMGCQQLEKEIFQGRSFNMIILQKLVRGGSWGRDIKDVTGDYIMMMPFVPLCILSLPFIKGKSARYAWA